MKSLILVIFCWSGCWLSFGQGSKEPHAPASTVINGVVKDAAGKPIKDVLVYGGLGPCCPVRRESTKTDAAGKFVLTKPTKIAGFLSEGFQPATLVVPEGSQDLKIHLEERVSLQGRSCSRVPGTRQIGWHQVRFVVPNNMKIAGGKWDVDYVKYGIKARKANSWLMLWFGPYAISTDPDEELFLTSDRWSQRGIALPEIGDAGLDSRGHLKSGRLWRQTVIAGTGGARYQDVPEDEAKVYDQIMDSICFVPLSRQ